MSRFLTYVSSYRLKKVLKVTTLFGIIGLLFLEQQSASQDLADPRLRKALELLLQLPQGEALIQRVNQAWKIQDSMSLLEKVKWGEASRTDTVLTRHFDPRSGQEVQEREITIFIRQDQNQLELTLDLAHELVHAGARPSFDPYDPSLSAGKYVLAAIEGEGGEVEAVIQECEIGIELSNRMNIAVPRCKNYLSKPGNGRAGPMDYSVQLSQAHSQDQRQDHSQAHSRDHSQDQRQHPIQYAIQHVTIDSYHVSHAQAKTHPFYNRHNQKQEKQMSRSDRQPPGLNGRLISRIDRELVRRDFYRVGEWKAQWKQQIGNEDRLFPLISAENPKLYSSTGHAPYPIALMQEFREITEMACDNSRKRMRSLASQESVDSGRRLGDQEPNSSSRSIAAEVPGETGPSRGSNKKRIDSSTESFDLVQASIHKFIKNRCHAPIAAQ